MVAHCENVPTMHMPPRSLSPLWKRKVPSGRQPSRIVAPRSHRFCCPVEHQRQNPQDGMNEHTTWSPGLHPGDARPDLLDDAGALVAADEREAGDDVAVPEVLVGVAEPGRDDTG